MSSWKIIVSILNGKQTYSQPSQLPQTKFCSLYVYNKIDSVSLDFLDKLAREDHTCVMSCELDLGIQDVVDRCWEELRLIRIYTKRYVFTSSLSLSLTFHAGRALIQIFPRRSSSGTDLPSKMFVTRSTVPSKTHSSTLWYGVPARDTCRNG